MIRFKRILRRSFRLKVLVYYLAFAMAIMTSLPGSGSASVVPTKSSLENYSSQQEYDREADMTLILKVFGTENGQIALDRAGITMKDLQTYLGQLTDAQLNLVAEKLRAEIPPGAGAESVFWAIMLLILILFIIFLILDLTGVYKLPFRRG